MCIDTGIRDGVDQVGLQLGGVGTFFELHVNNRGQQKGCG